MRTAGLTLTWLVVGTGIAVLANTLARTSSSGPSAATRPTRTTCSASPRENNTSGITENYTRTPDGTPIGHREGSSGTNRNYIHPDALGSTSAVTDGSGTKVGGYTYDPYGNFLTASPDNSSIDFRFAGQYRSTSLSLYKMGLRWYDPKIGRFTQFDPLDQATDLRDANRSGYAGADPVNNTDPTGMDWPADTICSVPRLRTRAPSYCARNYIRNRFFSKGVGLGWKDVACAGVGGFVGYATRTISNTPTAVGIGVGTDLACAAAL